MNNIAIVMQREYMVRVRKKSFILLTIFAPILLVLLMFIPVLLVQFGSDKQTVAVIDRTGQYLSVLQDKHNDYTFVAGDKTVDEYKKEGLKGEISAVLEIRQDLLEDPNAITLFSQKQLSSSGGR